MFCLRNYKLSTTHKMVILNRSGCEGQNDTSLDWVWFDMGITFDETKFYFFP